MSAAAVVLAALVLCGCQNPDAPEARTGHTEAAPAGTFGEPTAPSPPRAGSQTPLDVRPTPRAAISAFAVRYVNWDYRTLTGDQRTLARMAVGAARLAENQAAASSASDQAISRGQIYNHGQVVSVAADATRSGWWVIVTREQTGGDSQYQGLPAAFHVTLARVAPVAGGYAIEQWLPQS